VRGLKVEHVAAEAGVSPALLYYHFDNRSDLIRAALERAAQNASVKSIDAGDGLSGFARVEATLCAEFSDDETVRDNAAVWSEVNASAVFDPSLREDLHAANQTWREALAECICAGQADGSIRADVDPQEAAAILASLVDGLCSRWLAGSLSPDEARALLRKALTDIFSP
jgi:AcrR family transcriptional regulator